MNNFADVDNRRKSKTPGGIDPSSGIDVKRYTLYEVQNRKSLDKFTGQFLLCDISCSLCNFARLALSFADPTYKQQESNLQANTKNT